MANRRLEIVSEIRRAARSLASSPWYAITVTAVIGLSMALAITIFAVVDAALYRPLNLPDPEGLFSIEPGFREEVRGTPWLSADEIHEWSRALPDFELTGFDIAQATGVDWVNRERMPAAMVDPNFFDVTGVEPFIGGFTSADFEREDVVAIISHEMWLGRFAGDSDIVGRELQVDPRLGGRWTIVGVLPEGFIFPSFQAEPEILLPLSPTRVHPSQRTLEVILRAPAKVPAEVVQQRLEAILLANLEGRELRPGGSRFRGPFDRVTVHGLHERLTVDNRSVFLACLLAAALLLVIACLNVSFSMLARSLDRSGELALRRALGAGNWDIARAVITENAVLTCAGGVGGLLASVWLLEIVKSSIPHGPLIRTPPSVDWRVGAAAVSMTVMSALLVSVWPLTRTVRGVRLASTIRGSGLTPSAGTGSIAFVIATQVAAGMILTIGGTLLVGSLVAAITNDTGYEPRGLMLVDLAIAEAGQSEFGQPVPGVAGHVERFLGSVRAVPGVDVAGVADFHILDRTSIEVVSFALESASGASTPAIPITSGFLEALDVPLITGRFPTDSELETGARVIAVSEMAARLFWPGETALGKRLRRLRSSSGELGATEEYTVVGVARDARYVAWDTAPSPIVYGPYVLLNSTSEPVVAIRVHNDSDLHRVLDEVVRIARDMGPELRAIRANSAADLLASTIRQRRFLALLFGSFAASALAIIGIGIFGTLAVAAGRRQREIGIRIAVGATPPMVARWLTATHLRFSMIGLALGCLGAGWALNLVDTYVYGVSATNPLVWLASIGMVMAAVALGAFLPTLRASRVDPVEVLRSQ